jgi:hypothetical protein
MKKSLLLSSALAVGLAAGCSAQAPAAPDVQKIATEIRIEATRQNDDTIGRALPLLASWNTGELPTIPGMTPATQLTFIEAGHHIIPSFAFPQSSSGGNFPPADEKMIEAKRDYYEAPLKRAAELQLPITLISTQWERWLSDDKKYFDLPADQNPNVVTPEGKIENKVSPFGPVELWREVGAQWASSPLMKQVQQWYPNPPLVVLLSNNEHRKLTWTEVETDARYLAKYGKGRDDDFKRKVVADGWIERHKALHEGMREALSKSWQDKVIFAGYGAFGAPHLGRWGGWANHSLHSAGRMNPEAQIWDMSSPSYYTHHWNPETDYKVWSPQIESMNWIFMQKEALKANPNYRFGISVWDGHVPDDRYGKNSKYPDKRGVYRALGQNYEPPRYAGYAQFGMWLLRPREVREYRDHTTHIDVMKPYFLALAEVVDRIYENKTLQEFWRKGELVPNRAQQHPYQNAIPEEWKNEDRWFLLDTNLDPPRPWKLDTEIPVFSLALVQGEKGARRWLVYAHSPVEDRENVEITIPEYGKITADVPVAGAFYVVDEKTKKVASVQ